MHKLLVNHLFKSAQEKVWLSELTKAQSTMTIAVEVGRKATKKKKKKKKIVETRQNALCTVNQDKKTLQGDLEILTFYGLICAASRQNLSSGFLTK